MADPTERVAPAPLLTTAEVADYLQVSESTLSRWRSFKSGPKFVNLGGIFRYRLEDVEEYIGGCVEDS